jgi:hypothetical protein
MGRNARRGAVVSRGSLSTRITVPIGYTDRKSLGVTAARRAEAVRAGTVQSAAMAHPTAWAKREIGSRSASGGNGRDGLPVFAGSARVAG